MPLLAFTTFAILRAPYGDAQVQGFFDRLPAAFGAADSAEGFVDRSTRDPVTLKHTWGDYVPARFLDPARHGGVVFTLSRWRSLEAVHAYACMATPCVTGWTGSRSPNGQATPPGGLPMITARTSSRQSSAWSICMTTAQASPPSTCARPSAPMANPASSIVRRRARS